MISGKTILWIKKDLENRKVHSKFELKKLILKSLLYSEVLNIYKKLYFDKKFKKYPYKASISKYRTHCMFLGNSRAIIRRFKLSRHSCKKYASLGFITGLKKSSF